MKRTESDYDMKMQRQYSSRQRGGEGRMGDNLMATKPKVPNSREGVQEDLINSSPRALENHIYSPNVPSSPTNPEVARVTKFLSKGSSKDTKVSKARYQMKRLNKDTLTNTLERRKATKLM